jgi:ribonuclease D
VRTPIDQDYDVLSLIQISTEEEIYLVDPYNAKHPQIKAIFKEYFGNKNKTVIGHTIYDDVGTVADFFEIGRPTCKIIDIKKEYEGLNSSKQVGLKSISKEILGKEICKKYTMTNWDRRPLNLCQLHYAAMDAYIILKIWDKLSLMIEERKKNPNPI